MKHLALNCTTDGGGKESKEIIRRNRYNGIVEKK